jgi:hypothetical protein
VVFCALGASAFGLTKVEHKRAKRRPYLPPPNVLLAVLDNDLGLRYIAEAKSRFQ